MKKGEKKKQQKALKRRTESGLQRQMRRAIGSPSPLVYLRQARNYPIEGCWIRRDWKATGLAVIVLARRQPNGNVIFGNYLVDRYCLGLKNTFFDADVAPEVFKHSFLPKVFQGQKPLAISPALAHEIIYGAIEYAAHFGFKPQRDFRDSQYILDPVGTHPRSGQVEFGKDGKPLFINGPYDNVDRILQQLRRTAGDGNFDFIAMLGSPDDGFSDFDADEWDGV
jgi:hypothetical protein